jgi:cytochrome c-type biogenesis protein CcmF
MIELGHYSLIAAWVMTLFAALALWFSRRRPNALRVSGYRAVVASFALLAAAAIALLALLASHDFRVEYVAAYTSLDLPMVYVLTAFWGGQAGSLLFWTLLLGLFSVIVLLQNRGRREDFLPYVALVILVVQHFFITVMLWTANPFQTLAQAPADGRGLNPLLQNFFMVIHPPFLYLGYVAFTVPFAFAIAALALGREDAEWIKISRRWTLGSWAFLTAGILLGAYWAYIELGWGGYWAWDPVENASLMPWLVATAFLHSMIAQRKQGALRRWNFALIILTFELCIFGTFLTRSGVVSSVHAFGDSNMGWLFVVFMATSLAVSLALLLARASRTESHNEPSAVVSRESAFVVVNLLFLALTAAVMGATMYPAIIEYVTGKKAAIDPAVFNRFWPFALAILVLLALAPGIAWRKTDLKALGRSFLPSAAAGALVGALLVVFGIRKPVAIAFFVVSTMVIVSMLRDYFVNARLASAADGRILPAAFLRQFWGRKRHYGAVFVHLGVAIAFIGILGSSSFSHEYDLTMRKGQPTAFGRYTAELTEFSQRREVNKDVVFARVRLFEGGRFIGEARPEKHFHFKFEQPQTEVAVYSRPAEDVYLVLQGWEDNGTVFVRVNVNPLISLLWLGGLMILAGGTYVMLPSKARAESSIQAEAPAEAGRTTAPAAKSRYFSLEPVVEAEKEEKR